MHGTLSSIDHILDHKSSLGKFRDIEINSRIFSDHNGGKKTNYNKHKHMEAKQHASE